MKINIIIPAYNEEKRIEKTIRAYYEFFEQKNHECDFELIVVVNGTTDKTVEILQAMQAQMPNLFIDTIKEGGKGLAIAYGFKKAAQKEIDLIGFVDADMATSPEEFYKLISNIQEYDGIIASRYMPGAQVTPTRPLIKRLGSRLVYETLVRLLFGLRYYDFQCGAKLFKHSVISKVAPHLCVAQWAFDVELLYLCKRFGFKIKEFPTIWYDQSGSKLHMLHAGSRMIGTLCKLRWQYLFKS